MPVWYVSHKISESICNVSDTQDQVANQIKAASDRLKCYAKKSVTDLRSKHG